MIPNEILRYMINFMSYYLSKAKKWYSNCIYYGRGNRRTQKKEEKGTSWKERGRAHLAENVTQEIEDKLCLCVCVCVIQLIDTEALLGTRGRAEGKCFLS